MNKHQINILLTATLISLVLALHIFLNLSLLFVFIIIFFHVAYLMYGVFKLRSNYFFKSYTSNLQGLKQIALSFDDGPCTQSEVLLDLLKDNGVKASFFCIGKNCLQHPKILQRMDQEGHLIGNHSFSHSHAFDFFSSKKVLEEILATNAAIQHLIGKTPKFFRPPNGVSNPMIARALEQSKLKSIAWNIRTFDTQIKNVDLLFDKVCKQLKGGDIILMHDSMPHTVTLVSKLILYGKEHGFEFIRIDELLDLNAYE